MDPFWNGTGKTGTVQISFTRKNLSEPFHFAYPSRSIVFARVNGSEKTVFFFFSFLFLLSFALLCCSVPRTFHVFKLSIHLTYFPSRIYACVERRRHLCHHKDRNVLSQTNK